ncbi:sodium-dependent transporter [Myxococcota bacterium]|nr:sodium-dependent transporter [Myxococcota bacterium]MBU1381064.1 sodium-dependent transporter [Myxococcota bacterium]MBU1499125.1 sodium-dependent transporter [Myxococcota bacterium]
MSSPSREQWNSSLGFILAAAGSAIGLGNIWRFPYITGQNGGGSFVLLYLIIVFTIGLPVMYLELSTGRFTQRGPVGAMEKLAPGSFWKIIGYLAVITGIGILSYYSVVAGWTIWYFIKAIFQGFGGENTGTAFSQFVASAPHQLVLLGVFLGLTTGIVISGIKGGIEKISMILMPVLFLLMIGLIIYALTLDNAAAGLKYYLIPKTSDFTKTTFIFALGQAFFSLSLGMGAMLTYGSYLSKKENLVKAGFLVVLFDTLIAIMAGLIIFPVIGGAPEKAGAGLVFVVITELFCTLPGGRILGALFFLLLTIAALTSTISLLEVAASWLMDEYKMVRKKAALIVSGITFVIAIPSALSLGASKSLSSIIKIGGEEKGFLGIMDFLFGNLSLAIGGLLIIIFVVFKWKLKNAEDELYHNADRFRFLSLIMKPLIWFAAPAAIMVVLGFMLFTGKTLS